MKKIFSIIFSIIFSALLFLLPLIANCGIALSEPIEITDVLGRIVSLSSPAASVVGTHNPTMNIAVILGGGGQYIAGFGNKNMAGRLYSYVYPELEELVQIGKGRDINYESCLAVNADLAILPERFADLVEQFEEIGIPAAVILPNAESFETIQNSIQLLGTLLGEDERAAQIVDFFNHKIAITQDIAQSASYHPRVICLGASSQLTVANGLMLQSTLVETAGAVNIAKDAPGKGDFVEVTLEEIIAWDPEIVLIPVYAQYSAEDLLSDPTWSSIQAIKAGKVLVFPSALEPWDYPTPSASLALVWLVSNLHPDLYSAEQVLADAQEYYELVYGQSFDADQLGL